MSEDRVTGHERIDYDFVHEKLSYDAGVYYQPCVKVSLYFKKLPNVSWEHFSKHWATVHADITVSSETFKEHGCLRYVQHHQSAEDKEWVKKCGHSLLDYDGCTSLWFKTWEAYYGFLHSPGYKKIGPDCAYFLDTSTIVVFAGAHLDIIKPALSDQPINGAMSSIFGDQSSAPQPEAANEPAPAPCSGVQNSIFGEGPSPAEPKPKNKPAPVLTTNKATAEPRPDKFNFNNEPFILNLFCHLRNDDVNLIIRRNQGGTANKTIKSARNRLRLSETCYWLDLNLKPPQPAPVEEVVAACILEAISVPKAKHEIENLIQTSALRFLLQPLLS
ncbi:uncharacterized protein E0L32_001850 [Thyridium curvatum]|uniref:EthD domain-containing protein n=1 Tax=Thyridium curvatum TaxID=1093900 RepID=A0A507AFF6_9PEZI|nr:uncharacterized protein E0L32_001829 [Thyridium curvatum]XP_030989986.1 uncharacterized protein E0L32_001850 [Thyridium curvatum]TPX08254.1 hypothetical protein E0L32_001829 [Thyridium curvatum]TPX08275.1 hypothetical protein E0L32_001850 [Thyridium curvatum]